MIRDGHWTVLFFGTRVGNGKWENNSANFINLNGQKGHFRRLSRENKFASINYYNCWRALARQHPILYNSENKVKSVGCKIEDMRRVDCVFYIQAFRGACESIDSRSARNQRHDNRGEMWMSLITCGSDHEWLSGYSRGRRDFYVFG